VKFPITAPVMPTDELIEALGHAMQKVAHIGHSRELQALHAQLMQRRYWADNQERLERAIEESFT